MPDANATTRGRRRVRRAPKAPRGPFDVSHYRLGANDDSPPSKERLVWSYRTKTTEEYHLDFRDATGKPHHIHFKVRRRSS